MSSTDSPFFSICIPAYNRANCLGALLDSVINQGFSDYEIIICEDHSPERDDIERVCQVYIKDKNAPIRLFKNNGTLGYDGNLRRLIEESRGEYCFFLGNDDLMYPEALNKASILLKKYPNTGVFLRSYFTFSGEYPVEPVEKYFYFDRDLLFEPGSDTIATFFRRSVVISGLIVHRVAARDLATDEYDGSLLYQLFLVGNILSKMRGIYCSHPMAWYRLGGIPDFGNAEAERGHFRPKEQTVDSSIFFMQQMMKIAAGLDVTTAMPVLGRIKRDISNYSYPILAIQSSRSKREFFSYGKKLWGLGLGGKFFYGYFVFLMVFGSKTGNFVISVIKRVRGNTPKLGRIFEGNPI
jgi:abequosyltransferase